jgi:hypothetical protein
MVVRGTSVDCKRTIVHITLTWLVLGFPLSFKKGAIGRSLEWTGSLLTVDVRLQIVSVEIPELKVDELRTLTLELYRANVIPIKALRSYSGKCSNVAQTIIMWRPFLSELWAALCSGSGTDPGAPATTLIAADSSGSHAVTKQGPPRGCVWTKQIASALLWIYAFLAGQRGAIKRTFTLSAYMRQGDDVTFMLDASPWGFGAAFLLNGKPLEFYGIPISEDDLAHFKAEIGVDTFQQLWEALNILIAMRHWEPVWKGRRCTVRIKGDNMSALTAVAYYKAKGVHTAEVAKEFALTFSEAEFAPDFVSHTPGVSLYVVDALSRRFEPGRAFRLPSCLAECKEVQPKARDAGYYLAARAPPMP